MDDLSWGWTSFDGVVMDFELFYEEIEGLDLYMLSRRFVLELFKNKKQTR
jgi:hypothetical protein